MFGLALLRTRLAAFAKRALKVIIPFFKMGLIGAIRLRVVGARRLLTTPAGGDIFLTSANRQG